MNILGLILYGISSTTFTVMVSAMCYDWMDTSLKKKNHPSVALGVFYLLLLGSIAYGLWTYV